VEGGGGRKEEGGGPNCVLGGPGGGLGGAGGVTLSPTRDLFLLGLVLCTEWS
jgi:hypothetical protein